MFKLLILIDAAALVALLKIVNDDEIEYLMAAFVALVTAIATTLIGFGLTMVMGFAGLILGAVISAILLGVAVSALYGVEIKRAFLIGGLFMLVHIGVAFGLELLFSAPAV